VAARRFAEGTEVSVEKSRDELERLVNRRGATGFVYGRDGGVWTIAWRMHGRHVRYRVVSPSLDEMEYSPGGRWRPEREREKAVDAEVRRRWRALLLIVKAKLELVASGDADFGEEFLAQTLLPDNTTVGEWIAPQIDRAYEEGRMPALVPGSQPALGSGRSR
jgi:hypothetical protein